MFNFPRHSSRVKKFLGPVFISQLQHCCGVTTVRSLAGKIEGKNYSSLYNKYNNGESLPCCGRMAKLCELCPEISDVYGLLLWGFIDIQEKSIRYEITCKAIYKRSKEVNRIFTNVNGQILHLSSSSIQEQVLEPLKKIGNLDALYALLTIYIWSSDPIIDVNNRKKILRKIVDSTITLLHNLTVFTPLYPIRNEIHDFLIQDFFPDNGGFDISEISTDYDDKITNELRELIEYFGVLGLIGSDFSEQMKLVYWYRKDGHGTTTINVLKSHDRIIKALNKTAIIETNCPLYSLLKRMGHWGTKQNLSISIPKRKRYGKQFHRIASAIESNRERSG